MSPSALKRPPAPPPPPPTKYGGARMVGAGKKPLSRSLRMYQRIAVAFVGVTFLLLVAVLYLSISRATITIVSNPKLITVNAVADAVPNPDQEGEIAGVVKEKTFTAAKTFTLPSEGAEAREAKAGGIVTLENTSSTAQALVATTRVLSESGVLFRLDKAVNVPAKGKVDAMVHADVAGKAGEIGPSTFTIPGLNATRQAEVFASSKSPMVGGVVYVRSLTEKDVADAAALLSGEMESAAKAEFSAGIDPALNAVSLKSEVTSQKTDVPVGTETGAFTLTQTMQISAVYYPGDLVKTYAKNLFLKRVPEGFEPTKINTDGMQVKIESFDVKAGTARISLYLDGTAKLSPDSDALNKDRFVGRSPNEVLTMLRSHEGVREVTVSFTPFWLKRVPTLKDHIKVIVEEPK